jgi:hypothetical protein
MFGAKRVVNDATGLPEALLWDIAASMMDRRCWRVGGCTGIMGLRFRSPLLTGGSLHAFGVPVTDRLSSHLPPGGLI